MFGSGQWTIYEGYAGVKLFKGGFRSNNIDPNARHCMASAVCRLHAHLRHRRADGLLRRFRGMPTPSCSGARTWRRCIRSCGPGSPTGGFANPDVKIAVLSTYEHRSFELADIGLVFQPQTDLVILNYIANHIIKTSRVNHAFVEKHTIFMKGRDRHRIRPAPRARVARRRPRKPPRPTMRTADHVRGVRQSSWRATRSTMPTR